MPLMTPAATVYRISRTAKRPSGGKSVKDSTHRGDLVGSKSTMQAFPVLTNLQFSSNTLPGGTTVHLHLDELEFVPNVSSVAIQDTLRLLQRADYCSLEYNNSLPVGPLCLLVRIRADFVRPMIIL
jgi:hypothetical protein